MTTQKTHRRSTRLAALAVAAPLAVMAGAAPASAETEVERPDTFTSAYTVMATPDTIINNDGAAVPGQDGATGTFTFMINSDEEIICYDITLQGVTGEYESPAKTATHIHEATAGNPGPPRISFPNPTGEGDTRTSSGCLQGPFTTGLAPEGTDTGEGFTLAQIEADGGAGFSADTHTAEFAAGAVRGQLQEIPVGGVDTGAGGLADAGAEQGAGTAVLPLAATSLGLLAAAGVMLRRRVGAQR